jgi:type VI secretion system secreted protein Hcp
MKPKTLFLLLVLAFAAITNAKASLNLYIKTDPALPGEVTTPAAYVDAWEVLSFSIGMSNPVQVAPSGFTSGSPSFSDLSLQKMLDKASVASLLKLAQGTQGGQLNSVTLSCVNAANNALVYEIKLEPVVFSTIQHSGSAGGDARPTESVSFTYGKITWTYYPTSGPSISHFWDLRTNTGG